jgi:hypothetical protein
MNQESRSDPINDGRKNEEKRRDHSTEFIRSVRYAKGIGIVITSEVEESRRATQRNFAGSFDPGFAPLRMTARYFAAWSALLSRALRRLAAFS